MKKRFFIACILVIALSAALIGYGVYVNYAGESTIMDKMAKRSLAVNASVVAIRPIQAQYLIKEVVFEAKQAFDVTAGADGLITTDFLRKNQKVKKGELLMELRNDEIPLKIISANSALKRAKAVETQARNSFNRYSMLMEQDATSLEKFDEAKSNYEASMAEVENAQAQYDQAQLMQAYLSISSPANGRVVTIYKQRGSYVSIGTPLCMIADDDMMNFSLSLPSREIDALLGRDGMNAAFTLTSLIDQDKVYSTVKNVSNQGETSGLPVKILSTFPLLDQPASMRRVVFCIENKGNMLEPHSYTHLLLTANATYKKLTVNNKALHDNNSDDSRMMLYVVKDNNTLELREVRIGTKSSKYTEVLSGISAGEKVVISGTEGLTDGQKVEINYLEES